MSWHWSVADINSLQVTIKTSNRFHAARENSFLGRRTCVLTLLLQEDRTARPNGHKSSIVWWRLTYHSRWRWHILRTTRCWRAVACKRLSYLVIWLAMPKILDGPKHDFLSRNGTNGHEQPRSVPSGSTRSNRVQTRPHRCLCFVDKYRCVCVLFTNTTVVGIQSQLVGIQHI